MILDIFSDSSYQIVTILYENVKTADSLYSIMLDRSGAAATKCFIAGREGYNSREANV